MDNQKLKDFFGATAASLALVMAGCLFFQPRWETNDDIAMSMVAHGYGIVATDSPNLIFSNVLWGYFVRLIPEMMGALGYSLATLGILVVAGATILYALRLSRFNWVISVAALSLAMARPILFPQFTVNSGLITVGAIICWHLYGYRHGNKLLLWVGCLFAFIGYLIRSEEFFLVLLTGMPFIHWASLVKDRPAKIAVLFLLVALAGAKFIDLQSYQGQAWQDFNAFNYARAPYTDFGAGPLLMSRPDVYEKYGYSQNDIQLFSSWGVYADPQLADPHKLVSMLKDVGFVPDQGVVLDNVMKGLLAFLHPSLLPFCIILLVLIFNYRLGFSLGVLLLAVVGMSILGRPGVIRVYYPPLVLLFVFAVIFSQDVVKQRIWNRAFYLAVFLASLMNSWCVISESVAASRNDKRVRSEIHDFPTKPVIVWGGKFPYEAAYPVLNIPEVSRAYKMHGFGVFSPAPFSVALRENQAGRSVRQQLASPEGMPIVAGDDPIAILGRYCDERLHGNLEILKEENYGPVLMRTIRCEM